MAAYGIANPIATFWSASMTLDHLGESRAAGLLMDAVERVTSDSALHPPDVGGTATMRAVTDAVVSAIQGQTS